MERMLKLSLLTVAIATVLTACGDRDADRQAQKADAPRSSGGVDLTGAGATFPYPIYSKWFSDYAAATGVRINYQSIGSGGGIRQLSERTIDFGASDSPMTDAELAKAKGGPILHVPTVIGAVAVTYNLPGVQTPLKLTGDVLADVFLGKVTKWNDARIAALNAGVNLPARDILVVHRSDGSGTTYIFTDYLTAVSPPWASGPGKGKEVQWPVGLGGKGNEGVAGQVKQTPGAIGYVELAYAKQNRLPVTSIRNSAGNYVAPSVESATAAAGSAVEKFGPNTDYRVSIVNAPGAEAYPISSFTWILVYQNQPDSVKGRKIVDFLKWALTKGESAAPTLDYAPLPSAMTSQLEQRLTTIKLGAGA
jgi:phosphate transport system substrate-binding protein